MLGWLFGKKKVALQGDGDFAQEIVGESFYQPVLAKIAGPKKSDGKEYYCKAELHCDDGNPHDENAVVVKINGNKVGHLSRDDAREFRYLLEENFSGHPILVADAVIVGGWKNNHSEGHYGVKLDIG